VDDGTVAQRPGVPVQRRRLLPAVAVGQSRKRGAKRKPSIMYRPNAMSEYEALSVATISGFTPPSRAVPSL
jgi:hypothetical protein